MSVIAAATMKNEQLNVTWLMTFFVNLLVTRLYNGLSMSEGSSMTAEFKTLNKQMEAVCEALIVAAFTEMSGEVKTARQNIDDTCRKIVEEAGIAAKTGRCGECNKPAVPGKRCDYCQWTFCKACNELNVWPGGYLLCFQCHEYEPYYNHCKPSRRSV